MKKTLLFSTLAITIIVGFASCSKENEKPLSHLYSGNSGSSPKPASTNGTDYGPVESGLMVKWDKFKKFVLENASVIRQNTYEATGLPVEQLKTVDTDSALIQGAVTGKIYKQPLSIEQVADSIADTRHVATLGNSSVRNIEIGPHRHTACGYYTQVNADADITVIAKNGEQFTWKQAPIQTQFAWTNVPATPQTNNPLGKVTSVTIWLQ